MKRLLQAASALVCLLIFSVCQAQMTTVTASFIKMSGTAITSGS